MALTDLLIFQGLGRLAVGSGLLGSHTLNPAADTT